MLDPISTYRIQFHKDFTFKDFETVVPYLYDLGIKTIYASPIFQAVPASTHGYDVTDPNRINPEVGTIEELRKISVLLKSYDMFWIQDIVPNHMGFHQDNLWLMDVLKNGERSAYRKYFDLVTADLNREPVMVPFLGDELDAVIANGDLELVERNGEKRLKYFDSFWPLRPDVSAEGLSINQLAKRQYYRLCSYQETNSRINFRRFFTVNSLICLNMEEDQVFQDYHRLTLSLIEEGIFQGLRIDHIDGLADPAEYLNRLRQMCGQEVYIVAEKILEPGEQLPGTWPIEGTTGYDYLGLVNQLFTNDKAQRKFDEFYKEMGSYKSPVHDQVLKKKQAFLDRYMQGELDNLYQLALDLGLTAESTKINDDLKKGEYPLTRRLIAALLVRLPVYRFYSSSFPLLQEETETLHVIFDELEAEGSLGDALPEFRGMITGKTAASGTSDPAIVFYKRLMQFSGPLMAKGVEDTLMYTFNRFIGNNEVGDSPEIFGISPAEFHEQISARSIRWPYAMNAGATHDTKRGEDARTRLAVLTDLKSEWISQVKEWQQLNSDIRQGNAPDANDEYFIYQTLIATCPQNGPQEDDYEQRLLEYIEKALRESKRKSEWDEPDQEYESHTKDFIQYLLDPSRPFWERFYPFLQQVAAFGKLASLSSLVLKHTLPGIPDTYQGTELWDLSMVDPDNRRAVDYEQRRQLLAAGTEGKGNGMQKIRLLNQLLQLRKQDAGLFSKGLYLPLAVRGHHARNVIAYARHYKNEWLLVAVVINLAALDWEDTHLILPQALTGAEVKARDVFGDAAESMLLERAEGNSILKASDLFTSRPYAVYRISLPANNRGAGILLPVSSLPSDFGIGDFGPSTKAFLSFLAEAGMKYWQMLPLNPLTADQGYSPYSSTSVMAGNVLLISPEELAVNGLLSDKDLKSFIQKAKRKVNYERVLILKEEMLEKAFIAFKQRSPGILHTEFEEFCAQNNWLSDYSLFVLISSLQDNKPWFKWTDELKNRDAAALHTITEQYSLQLEEICWQQFIFFRQWKAVKESANALGIELIGDLPFYTAHNSADVWAHSKFFALQAGGEVAGAAGVPPDYFNADGQLWGMPVYNWKAMAKNKYQWWSERIAMNLQLYDLVRLDHFRAFAEYWEVPSGSGKARSGAWKPGPGAEFFQAIKAATGQLPLIAEDLGEISPQVYMLRDQFQLPGMKVLQFAFGEDVASSVHAPHNFADTNCIVYTGTHDNNTTRGWFRDVDQQTRTRLEKYLGAKLSGKQAATQLIRLALSTTAATAIIPMQDLLNKPAKSRINTPASIDGNWSWRMKPGQLTPELAAIIRSYLRIYNRL